MNGDLMSLMQVKVCDVLLFNPLSSRLEDQDLSVLMRLLHSFSIDWFQNNCDPILLSNSSFLLIGRAQLQLLWDPLHNATT